MNDILTKDDLLFNPEELQPLGTVKGKRNKPTHIDIDLKELFLTIDNQRLLYSSLYKVYTQNGGKASRKRFIRFLKNRIYNFAETHDLRSYKTAEFQATGTNNYVECLRAINNAFVKDCYNYFSWNSYNPVRDKVEVGPANNRVLKKGYKLMPEDHGTLELWREQFVQVLNSQFRDNNRIPAYQTTLQTRHYDRDNEGLRNGDPDRASLETPIYGYDMTQIYNNLDNYKSRSWYSM